MHDEQQRSIIAQRKYPDPWRKRSAKPFQSAIKSRHVENVEDENTLSKTVNDPSLTQKNNYMPRNGLYISEQLRINKSDQGCYSLPLHYQQSENTFARLDSPRSLANKKTNVMISGYDKTSPPGE